MLKKAERQHIAVLPSNPKPKINYYECKNYPLRIYNIISS